MKINVATGQVTVSSIDEEGKPREYTETMKLPADLANGLVTTLLKDIDPKTLKTTVSMVVATPKPRLVKLASQPDEARDSFTASNPRRAECNGALFHADLVELDSDCSDSRMLDLF